MFEFLARGRTKSDQSATDPGPSTMPMLGVQNSATQREMVRFALHNVLKRHGIPGTWLAGEVVPVHIPGVGEALIMQLDVIQWQDALVLRGPALQQQLLAEMLRFDPSLDPTRFLFTWRFGDDCNCPHKELPMAEFWAKLAPQAASPAATESAATPVTPLSSVTVQLPDEHDDDDDHGFAPTEIREGH